MKEEYVERFINCENCGISDLECEEKDIVLYSDSYLQTADNVFVHICQPCSADLNIDPCADDDKNQN